MAQAIVGILILGLGGLIWVIVLDKLGPNRQVHDKTQEDVYLDI